MAGPVGSVQGEGCTREAGVDARVAEEQTSVVVSSPAPRANTGGIRSQLGVTIDHTRQAGLTNRVQGADPTLGREGEHVGEWCYQHLLQRSVLLRGGAWHARVEVHHGVWHGEYRVW